MGKMPPRRGLYDRGKLHEQGKDIGCDERMDGGVHGRRRRRCACVRPRAVAATVAVAVATSIGVNAASLVGNSTCGVEVHAGSWTTRACEQSCGRKDVVCAYRLGGECDVQDVKDAHYCVSYAGEGDGESDKCHVECLAVGQSPDDREPGEEWVIRVTKSATSSAGVVVGPLEPPASVSALAFVGGERWNGDEAADAATTRVEFSSGLKDAAYLISMVFIGLDLTSTGLPPLPSTLTHLRIEGCVLAEFPVDLARQLPALESLELYGNRHATVIGSDVQNESLPSISEQELLFLSPRLGGDQHLALGTEAGTKCAGGRGVTIGDFSLCVDSTSQSLNDYNATALARRLADANGSGSDGSSSASSSSSSSGSDDSSSIWPTSKYVFMALAAPFLYFIYKVGLFFYFLKTYPKHEREHDGGAATSVDTNVLTPHPDKHGHLDAEHDSDTQRPTLEGSSGSLSRSPAPIGMAVGAAAASSNTPRAESNPRPQQQQLASANFWVDEELQSWRLDFRLFAMQRCLTLSASQKRQTLRKASVTTALHPREIWLASYKVDGIDTSSPDQHRLVALKFVPPTTSTVNGGGPSDASGSQDKLRAELRRQAQFSHPNVAAFIGVAWSPQTHLVAVTEYLEQGDLRQWLHRTNRPTEAQDGQVFGPGIWSVAKLQMLVDLARALVYLHSMHPPVAHGNCNSRNVLLTSELRAKWSDFGNAAGEVLSERDRLAYSAVGSGRWISPEALLGRETVATPKGSRDAGDVYSFGILMAEIDSHALPFSDLMRANRSALPETDILQLIAQGALSPTLSVTCAPAVVELVAECTRYAPAQRPSSKQVLAKLQRALQDAKDAAVRQKAARVAPPVAGESDEINGAVSSGDGGEQFYYYAGDESKAAPSFV